ncbi:MAG: ABC transporter permease subunit [Treponema sp.]|nr:ABC transporter permease subunit [Treponema sp.]
MKNNPVPRKTQKKYFGFEQLELQSMMVPALALLILFTYIPMWGVLMAFQKYNIRAGFWGSEWVGLANFREFIFSRNFTLVMRNTLAISFLKLLVCFPAPILLALFLNEVKHRGLRRVFQTITYLPYFLSWVVVAGMVFSMLSGVDGSVNRALIGLGILKEPYNFLSDPNAFWPILIGVNVWKGAGFQAIIYIAAITGINPEYYEAAEIDGAGKFRKIWHITLPCIAPQIIILLILAISGIMNAGFEDVYLLTNSLGNGVLLPVADVIDTHVYRMGVLTQRYSYSTAVGLFKSVIGALLLVGANQLSRKLTESALW